MVALLGVEYDQLFFDGTLGGCEVKWSRKMTLCAGLCTFQPASGFCSIRLSEPLLRLRPRRDLVNTLLHEMIHAFLFLHATGMRDHDDHGPQFQFHMNRINAMATTQITVYHTFHDEVDAYRVHWWQCNGPCRSRKPYFGLVKRAMNRAPSPRDPWWAQHARDFGGQYTNIKEPPPPPPKAEKQPEAKKFKRESNQPAIHSFFTPPARQVDRGDVKKPKLASVPRPPPPRAPQMEVMAPPPPPRIEIDLTIDSD
ncbi:unnamed protein product [Aphanomyces euteiches]